MADIAGIIETDCMVEERQRIADLTAGRPVEVDTSALWLALCALGNDRFLVGGPRVGRAHDGRRWTVAADGSFVLLPIAG